MRPLPNRGSDTSGIPAVYFPQGFLDDIIGTELVPADTGERNMAEIGPVRIEQEESQIVIRFADVEQSYLAVPPDLEKDLAVFVKSCTPQKQSKTVVFDLQQVTALTSRHLGILVTAHKAFQPLGGCVLQGVSPAIRKLLEVTRMNRLFAAIED